MRTASSYWCSQGFRVYQAFPYHWLITPSRGELNRFMLRTGAVGLRYSTSLDAPQGAISYHTIYSGGAYDLVDLPRRARSAVRKGLRNATVEQISLETLARDGWRLRLETMQRQGRENSEHEDWWRRMCLTGRDLPGVEAWGCYCRGTLAAALLGIVCGDCYTLLYQQSATDFLNSGVNNALAYVVTRGAMSRVGVTQIFYGLEGLNASEDVDVFKVRMGYTVKPLRQRVVFNPLVSPVVDLVGRRAVTALVNRYSSKTAFTKMQGMLRFYENGKLPLEQQTYPLALADSVPEVDMEVGSAEMLDEPA